MGPTTRGTKRIASVLALAACVTLLSSASDAQPVSQELEKGRWTEEILELAESLPVQDGGRIKPLHTFAGFTMLRLNGKRSLKIAEDVKLTPVEWLLDLLYYPDVAAKYPVFLVQNDEVITAIGLTIEGKKKRDRYSYTELGPGLSRLFELAHDYGSIDEQGRTPVQAQLINLAGNVNSFVQLGRHMDFAQFTLPVGDSEHLKTLFSGKTEIAFHEAVEHGDELRALYMQLREQNDPELEKVAVFLQYGSELTSLTESMALIPPSDADEEEWTTPAGLFRQIFDGATVSAYHVQVLAGFEELAGLRGDPAGFASRLSTLHEELVGKAMARGDYDKIGLELTYYKTGVISKSLYLFILSFVFMSFMWLRPKSNALYALSGVSALGGIGFLVAGIVMRCLIRSRPPVSTLYETVLFVTAVGALVALAIEWMNRQRLAVSAAAILGMVGMFMANGFEMLDKKDTMPSLVAVLDTNFWLATHVTSITIGYSAGMLAALLGSAYLIAKTLRIKRDDRAFYRNLSRMVYGVLCFGLLFSIVGTILGGIWANDSWGRFWGWDPKENGAMLIVLSQIVIIHGRMGGYLREHGICMAAAFGGTVVAFSWWGVNLLGVGLHSYGFTSGIHSALWTYYGIQWGVVGLGGVAWLLERSRATQLAQAKATSETASASQHRGYAQ